jgi:hypothetical protein
MLTVVRDLPAALAVDGASSSLIDQIVREGARQMLAAALQAEVAAYIDQFASVRGENGRRMVVRNGAAETRTVLTSASAVEVTAPAGQRQAHRPADGGADTLLLGDLAAVGAQEPAGRRGAAAAVPAWAVQW